MMNLLLRRNRSDYLLESLAVYEREKAVNRALMSSESVVPSRKKQAFTRYSGAVMGIRRIQRELGSLRSA